MASGIFPDPKDPAGVLDYGWDFAAELSAGESIASHNVAVTGATLDSTGLSGTEVVAWVSGGTAGTDAEVAYTITTDSSPARTIRRTGLLRIRDK